MKRLRETVVESSLLPFDMVRLVDDFLWPSFEDFLRWKSTCSHYWSLYRKEKAYVDQWLLTSALKWNIPSHFRPEILQSYVCREIISSLMEEYEDVEMDEQATEVLIAVLEKQAVAVMRSAGARVEARGAMTVSSGDLKPVPVVLSRKMERRIGLQYVCNKRSKSFLKKRGVGHL
jgi:hypothetical protein